MFATNAFADGGFGIGNRLIYDKVNFDMNKAKFLANQKYFSYLSILVSLSLIIWSHFDKVHRAQAQQQRQIALAAINRDCAQLQRETAAHYRKGKALIGKEHWSAADLAFGKHFSQESKSLESRQAAIVRRCREFNAANRD